MKRRTSLQKRQEIAGFRLHLHIMTRVQHMHLFICLFSVLSVHAKHGCTSDADCTRTICENGKCVNPFRKGCLRLMSDRVGDGHQGQKDRFRLRVCNSDDDVIGDTENCIEPHREYMETRIAPGDWETALVFGWIYQIILSEIFGVPTTIESGSGERDPAFSFYDPHSRFKLPSSDYPVEQLVEAHRVGGDCRLSSKACSHILPEVWDAGKQKAKPFQDKGIILPGEPNGLYGGFGYYIPLLTMNRDRSLASYFGLRSDNREKIASTFKTPTNWADYCSSVSKSKCLIDDGIAKRAPETEDEKTSYFSKGEYIGHFRIAEHNNCTATVECTGTAIVPPCDWSAYPELQFYWNNVTLSPAGPLEPHGGYSYSSMIQIYMAANATRSDVFFWWTEPDILFEKFEGSDYALQHVFFPRPTMDCIKYRTSGAIDRCSSDVSDRIGNDKLGSCDSGIETPVKLLSDGFLTAIESKPESIRSPAYDFLKQVFLPQYGMQSIFSHWKFLEGKGIVDVEREGVCKWVYDNLEELLRNKPKGYPRTFENADFKQLSIFCYVMASITFLLSIAVAALTYKFRETREIDNAQSNVLYLVIIGHIFIAVAAITGASEPIDITCTLTQWFTRIGYTLALVPILIKVSTINKLTRDGNNFRKVEIDPNRFKHILIATICAVFIFLFVWTVVDAPLKEAEYSIIDEEEGYIQVHNRCSSRSSAWIIVAYGWECILLVSATILTIQSRDVIEELNESNWLAFLVYSHFVFLVLRLLATILNYASLVPSSICIVKTKSLLASFDALFGMCIYFAPKFYAVIVGEQNESSLRCRTSVQGEVSTSLRRNGSRRHISGVNLARTSINGTVPNLIRPRRSQGSFASELTNFSLKNDFDTVNGASDEPSDKVSRNSLTTSLLFSDVMEAIDGKAEESSGLLSISEETIRAKNDQMEKEGL